MADVTTRDGAFRHESASQDGRVVVISSARGLVRKPVPADGSLVVGRDEGCSLQIDDPSVSRRHARIVLGATIEVLDLDSRNGTFVGGARLVPNTPRPLAIGQVVQVGDTVLVFHSESATARTSAAAAEVVVASEAMQRLYDLLAVVAPSDLSVLVLGETGTGKEIYARALHDRSDRRDRRFLPLNCAALPESLLEAELFGFEKGAFTGATAAKAGLFESAAGGTVFLDEVGDMPAATQAKLLRFLESGEVTRLGGLQARCVAVRLVSATNRDLDACIAEGKFRPDLYYRIAGFSVTLPPLRQRLEEIPALAARFIAMAAKRLARPAPALAAPAAAALAAHTWPGNVRELRNVVERALVLAAGAPLIETSHLQLQAAAPAGPAGERERVLEALQRCGGNQKQAAQLLGVSRTTLLKKIEKYAIERPRKQ